MQNARPNCSQNLTVPAALAGIGSLMLLYNFGLFPLEQILRYWPVALIVAGFMQILESK